MAKLKEGDEVIVAAREQSAADIKSGLYYPHYAGLFGTILKLYGEEASVTVDRDSLPSEIRLRHEEGEKAMRQKYLDNLSEEARGRQGDREKNFALNYAVLVSLADLAPHKSKVRSEGASQAARPSSAGEKQAAKNVAASVRALDPRTGESDVDRAPLSADQAGESGTDSAAKRLSASDIEAAETRFLEERKAAAAKKAR